MLPILSLKERFKQLVEQREIQEDVYTIERGIGDNIFVGISPDGHASILIMLSKESNEKYNSISLNGIKTEFSIKCNYQIDSSELKQSVFNIVTCTDSSRSLQDFFFDFFNRFFIREESISTKQLKDEIDFIRELFANQKVPSRETIMGLWSELFIIYVSHDKEKWADKWSSKTRSTFDFEFTHIGLDVKSFGGNERTHRFQLKQLVNKSVEQTLILSTCCVEDDLGLSVYDLLDEISEKIEDNKLLQKIEKKVFKLSGPNILDSLTFNLNVAIEELRVLEGKQIPRIHEGSVPSTVTEVSFKSDCSDVPMLPFSEENQAQLLQGVLVFPDQ